MYQHEDLFLMQHGNCFYCETPMDSRAYKVNKKGYTIDHFIPKKLKLGAYLKYNHVLAHSRCNSKKGHELPTDEQITKFYNLMVDVINRDALLKTIPKGGPRR